MQNWNQPWQVSAAGTTAGTMPQPPTAPGYPTTGTDPMATMQANMQYFNQPAPSGYTAEQWATAQQQNWTQWQQYQQQYQQWQAQYGAKYQETIKQMSASGLSGFPLVPPTMPPPLPKEDTSVKPPLPPDNSYQFNNAVPPHQNNLPLFSKTPGNPPLPLGQPPPPPDNPPPSNDNFTGAKRSATDSITSDSAKKSKNEDDDLSHAEKTFDAQFKQWEEQFNKWKLQNANHPDKVQYKQYEAKWTSWREKLIERREQMRKKREAQRAKAESEKKKTLSGGEKLLNILTNTENQGLINNLLGIGKTLGLSGKDNPSGQVTQATTTASSLDTGVSTSVNAQSTIQSGVPGVPTTMTTDMTQQAWAAQQWAAQYSMATMAAATTFPTYPQSLMPMTNNQPAVASNVQAYNQMSTLGMSNANVNFSQPPPGFPQNTPPINSPAQINSSSMYQDGNSQYRRDDNMSNTSFNRRDSYDQSQNNKFNPDSFESNNRQQSDRDRGDQFRPNDSYDRDGPKRFNRDERNDFGNDNFRRDGPPRDFNVSGANRGSGNDFRPNDFYNSRDQSNDRNFDEDRSGRNDRRDSDQDRFGRSNKDSFNPRFDRDQGSNDRFRSEDRFSSNDKFNDDRFGSDRLGSDRFNPDRFGSSSNDRFSSDRFGTNQNKMDSRDLMDKRDNNRDFGNNNRNISKNNDCFDQPTTEKMPFELKKLMEKRRAAMDVFKPSSSFLTPEKSITEFGSLSESFRKITGDSPFLSRERPNEFGRDRGRGPGQFSGNSQGSDSFSGPDRSRDEFRDRGPSDFRSRLGDFNTSLDTSGPRRLNDFGPRGNNFGARDQVQDSKRNREFENLKNRCEIISPWDNQPPLAGPPLLNGPPRPFGDFMNRPEQLSRDNQSPQRSQPSKNLSTSTDGGEKNREPIGKSEENIPPLDMPPWMDPQLMKNPVIENEPMKSPLIKELPPPETKILDKESNILADKEPIIKSLKKPEGLPFMGENDPKPEDLNMEPPPELPDLGPIKGPDHMPMDTRRPDVSSDRPNFFNESFGPRGLPPKSDSLDKKSTENERFGPSPSHFGPREMNNSRGNAPSLAQQGPNNGPFGGRNFNEPPFNQRGPDDIPFGQRNCNEPPFGQRGPNEAPFNQRGPNDAPFNQRGSNDAPFNQRGPNDAPFGQRGPNNAPFGQRGPNEPPFNQRGPNEPPFNQRGPNDPPFNQRGPNEPPFNQRGPNEPPFNQRGPNEAPFGQRGPNEPPFNQRGLSNAPFGQRGPNEPPFGQRGLNEPPFGQRGPNEPPFGQRGPNEPPFGQRSSNEPLFGQRALNESPFRPRDAFDGPFDRNSSNLLPFGPRDGPDNRFNMRGPNQGLDFDPRGPNQGSGFGPRGQNQGPDFGPRGSNIENFPQRDTPFGSRGFNDQPLFRSQPPDEPFMPRKPNDLPFNSQSKDNDPKKIPSLLSFKFDEPPNFHESRDGIMSMDRPFDRSFGKDNQPPFDPSPTDDSRLLQNERDMSMRPGLPKNEPLMNTSKLGPAFAPGPMMPQRELTDQGFNRGPDMPGLGPSFGPINAMPRDRLDDIPLSMMDASLDDRDPFSRRPTNHPGYRRTGPMRPQFCIEKQFNYNHGGGAPAEIFTEFVPSKVIEYGNVRRPSAENYVTPIQCFDYGHGALKPNVIKHDIYPRIEFKNWLESEHNLKEYNDSLRAYEERKRMMRMSERNLRREVAPVWRYEDHRKHDDHRSWNEDHRERNEKSWREPPRNVREPKDYKSSRESRDSHRQKRKRERSWDREIESHRDEHVSKSSSEDRPRDKVDKTQKDSNTECNENDERSKGNVSRQENPMNNPVDSTIQESSKQDATSVIDEPPKTMELAKPSNSTMVDDLLCSPGRQNRPPKIAIILRGPPGSGKSFVAKLIKDKELEQGGSAPRILSLDDYFLTEKEVESTDDNGKKVINKEMVYEYEEAMEGSYMASLVKAFKKNITDGYFNFIILDCINEKISDYEEMWSFAKTKGFRVYVCEMEMDVQVCLKRNIHKRTEDDINKIVDYFEPAPSYHQILDVASLLQEQAIQEVQMEESESHLSGSKGTEGNDDSQDSQDDAINPMGVSKWEKMEAENKLDRLDGLAKRKNEGKPQTMEDFLQVPDYYNMEDTSGKKRVRWADLEERKEQEKMRAVGFVVGQTNWNRMLDPTKGSSALTRTKWFSNLT